MPNHLTCPGCRQPVVLPEGAGIVGAVCSNCGHRLQPPDDRPQAAPSGDGLRLPEGLTPTRRASGFSKTMARPSLPDAPAGTRIPRPPFIARFAVASAVAWAVVFFVWARRVGFLDTIGSLWEEVRDRGLPGLAAVTGAAALCLLAAGHLFAVSVKARVVRGLIDVLEFRACSPAGFPGLDERDLAKYTEALEALGFRRLTDYTLVKAHDNGLSAFARLFVHDACRCFAEINAVFNARGPVSPLCCNLLTFLEDGWSVSTTNRRARRGNYLLRRPRALWWSLPDRAPYQLLEVHREWRDRVTRDLGLAVVGDGTAEDYFRREVEANDERCDRVHRRPAWSFVLDSWRYDMSPKLEWLGDYASIARQQQG
jgi:hypothetical protein